MSLYIVDKKQINLRHPDLFLCHESLFESVKEIDNRIEYFDILNVEELLNSCCLFNNIEIIIPNIDSHQLINIIEDLVKYLEENEMSIGLLIDEKLIKENTEYFKEHNIYLSNPSLKKYNYRVKHRIQSTGKPPRRKRNNEELITFKKIDYFDASAPRAALEVNGEIPLPLSESFKKKLIKYINKSKKTNVEIYTKSGITRQVFSKIISYDDYEPKKETIICLIIGLELCLDDALDLLNAAGYTLSDSILFDVIIKGEIIKSNYDIMSINEILDSYHLQIIGWNPR